MTIKSKKDVIEMLKDGQTIKPIVIYNLIYNDILKWEEFENLFMLYYQGEYAEHIRETYREFWKIMENRISDNKEESE